MTEEGVFVSNVDKPVKNWSISVEPARVAPEKPAMWTPGPIDLKGYEAGHFCGAPYEAEDICGFTYSDAPKVMTDAEYANWRATGVFKAEQK